MTDYFLNSLTQGKDLTSENYWRAEAERWRASHEVLRSELDEFAHSSKELETELERELHLSQQEVTRLRGTVTNLKEENLSLKEENKRTKDRLEYVEQDSQSLKEQKASTLQYTRELEQKLDASETLNRILQSSFSDHKKHCEELLETKALLELELEQLRYAKEVQEKTEAEMS